MSYGCTLQPPQRLTCAVFPLTGNSDREEMLWTDNYSLGHNTPFLMMIVKNEANVTPSVFIFKTAREQYKIIKKENGNSNDNRLRAGENFKAI
ncbi:hypothetical protein pdam_00014576 [Pocillopora damicornis]|uniref:Uncharacterized protein n=1 Tax=Pocillopora damicornis TaxID=46731 RepID=A0A3M6UHL4_POCDA|nr:hypothetical protein pdam_00014576 [Pocillopora damicornis]